ncbi:hypothetical protein NBRC116600_21560 [Thalassotalea sp. SU-HH00458]
MKIVKRMSLVTLNLIANTFAAQYNKSMIKAREVGTEKPAK